MGKLGVVAVFASVALSACVSAQQAASELSRDQLVAVPALIGSLKCAFSEAMKRETGRQRLEGTVASVTLHLKVVARNEASSKLDLTGPAVLTFGAAGTVAPIFSGGIKRSHTIETTMKFRLRLAHEPEYASACDSTPNDARDAYGFEQWLAGTIAALEPNSAFAPAGALDSLQFKGSFGVENRGTGGGQFRFVFLTGNAEAIAFREDVQTIDFTIQRPTSQVQVPKGRPGEQGHDIMGGPGA